MSRSIRKFIYNDYTFLNKLKLNEISDISELKKFKIEALKRNWFLNKTLFIIKKKNDIILDYMVGLYFLVYNGNNFSLLFIKENMVGYRIGEFIITKKLGSQIHNNKRNSNKIK